MKRNPLYEKGDEVKIVKYGALIWENKNVKQPKLSLPLVYEDKDFRWLDLHHEAVGQTGTVSEVTITQGIPQYSIDGIKESVHGIVRNKWKKSNEHVWI